MKDTVRRTDVQVEKTPGRTTTTGWDTYANDFQKHYKSYYAKSGQTYDLYMPAYRYGYDLANDKQYSGDWSSFETKARTGWEAQHKGSWEQFKDAIRYAWDTVRGAHPAQRA